MTNINKVINRIFCNLNKTISIYSENEQIFDVSDQFELHGILIINPQGGSPLPGKQGKDGF
jgi:hypothetical protein